MTDKLIEQLKSLRDYIAKNLSEPYSDDDVVALDKAIAALERQRLAVVRLQHFPRLWLFSPLGCTEYG